MTYLKLNLGLSNVLLAAASAGDLLSLRNLVLDGLCAEVLKSVTLNSVDAELGAGLDGCETAGNCSGIALVEYPACLQFNRRICPDCRDMGLTYGRTACWRRPPQ